MPILRNCLFCNEEFKIKPSHIRYKKGNFCSKKCFYTYRIPLSDKFWCRVEKTDSCWIWKGSCDQGGYGQFETREKYARHAHRFSYFLHYGEIPNGMCVCHSCDNPSCVNPTHLFLGTNLDNINDRQKKFRQAMGLSQGLAKLKESDIKEIRNLANTTSRRKIGKLFNVAMSTINAVVQRKTWKYTD